MTFIQRHVLIIIISVLIVADAMIWHAVLVLRDDTLTLAFLDVGQGDAIFIEAPNGSQALIDGGRNRRVLSELGSTMPFFDRTIDVIIATHPDQDHIGGLPYVLNRFVIDYFFDPGVAHDTQAFTSLMEAVRDEEVVYTSARKNMKIWLDESTYLHILFPDRDMSGGDTNAASVIVLLVHGQTKVLLTGDAPRAVEDYVAGMYGAWIDVDVLKAGHHGSKTSTSNYFVAATTPAIAVISAGKDNRYGHPHAEVLTRLKENGAEIISTAENGTIVFESDGTEIYMK